NEEAIEVILPATHFAHVRKVGSFSETCRQAWQELHANLPKVVAAMGPPHAFFSLYQLDPEMVYMAGVGVQEKEVNLDSSLIPSELAYFHFPGGKYLQFTLTGPYDQLPTAVGRVFELVKERGVSIASDGRYFMENYANNPDTVPAEELVTHICIPI
ncbi:AraC family transcriptional regulator, partial [archaeon]